MHTGGRFPRRQPWFVAANLSILTVAVTLVGVKPAAAQLYQSLQRAAECTLNYTADTRSTEAVAMIRSACNDLYGRGPLSQNNRDYDICLLQHLSGVQNRFAAQQIATACRTVHPLF